MMDTQEAFMKAIIDQPDDDAVRLVYADWLDENGQPERAEFIRVQIELSRISEDDPRYWDLKTREEDLLIDRGDSWVRELPEGMRGAHGSDVLLRMLELVTAILRSPIAPVFRRGFPAEIAVGPSIFLEKAEDLF